MSNSDLVTLSSDVPMNDDDDDYSFYDVSQNVALISLLTMNLYIRAQVNYVYLTL